MQNISDDELDKLFKEASEKSDYSFDSSAWEQMNVRLDAHTDLGGTSVSVNSGIVSSVITVAILIVTFYYFQNDDRLQAGLGSDYNNVQAIDRLQPTEKLNALDEDANRNGQAIKNESSANSSQIHQNSSVKGDMNPVESLDKDALALNEKESKGTIELKSGGNNTPIKQISSTPVSAGNRLEVNPTKSTIRSINSDKDSNRSTSDINLSNEKDEHKKELNTKIGNEGEPIDEQKIKPLADINQRDIIADSIEHDDQTEIAVTDSVLNKEEKQKDEHVLKTTNRMAIKLSVSPDFTSIGYSKPNDVGFNYGLLFEYRLFNKLAISTGAIMSRKVYSGKDVEYTFSSRTYTADKLKGDCRIIDLPLNIYYYFSPENRISFFGSVGFTSYIMRKEDYSYTVNGYYGPKDYEVHVSGENNEWFKQLNVSIGVQKKISNHFALQAEPFLKAPLAGVGEGKVSLASLGAFLSLKYSF